MKEPGDIDITALARRVRQDAAYQRILEIMKTIRVVQPLNECNWPVPYKEGPALFHKAATDLRCDEASHYAMPLHSVIALLGQLGLIPECPCTAEEQAEAIKDALKSVVDNAYKADDSKE
jgi:hypothetical protein